MTNTQQKETKPLSQGKKGKFWEEIEIMCGYCSGNFLIRISENEQVISCPLLFS